jgi:hypothetical protein
MREVSKCANIGHEICSRGAGGWSGRTKGVERYIGSPIELLNQNPYSYVTYGIGIKLTPQLIVTVQNINALQSKAALKKIIVETMKSEVKSQWYRITQKI